jgi:hypothetical protein
VYHYPRSYCYYRNSGVLHTKLDVYLFIWYLHFYWHMVYIDLILCLYWHWSMSILTLVYAYIDLIYIIHVR